MIQPWFRWYDHGVLDGFQIPEVPLHSLLIQSAWRYPHHSAILYYGHRLTFNDLENLSYRFAVILQSLGLQKGDRVALHLPNIPQFVFAFYGILRAGGVVVPTNPLYVERELEAQLRDSGAETVVTLDRFYERVQKVRGAAGVKRVLIARIEDYLPTLLQFLYPLKNRWEGLAIPPPPAHEVIYMEDLLDQTPGVLKPVDISPEDLAALQYTGGTTGLSKGVMLSHRNLMANVIQCRRWLARAKEGEEVFLGVIPFFHAYGLSVCMNLAVLLGSPIILYPRYRTDDALAGIKKHQVTIFIGVEAMYQAVTQSPRVSDGDLASVRFCISGAGPLHAEIQERFESLTGGKLVEGYGLSEASPVTHCNPLYGDRRTGSIGIPLPGTDARIVDTETGERVLPPGEVGELIVKGPQVMQGYWNQSEETDRTLRNGWLFTGDLARMDRDGFFYIVDRKKEMIKTSGENVYPREVEEVLFRHPKIADAVVLGSTDPVKGEIVKAVIVLQPGAIASAEEIAEYCKKELARFKVPSVIEFRQELPKNILGKVLRRAL